MNVTLIPRDFSIPMSPFSTAMNTDLRCSTSVRCRAILRPKSSMVADSEMWVVQDSGSRQTMSRLSD